MTGGLSDSAKVRTRRNLKENIEVAVGWCEASRHRRPGVCVRGKDVLVGGYKPLTKGNIVKDEMARIRLGHRGGEKKPRRSCKTGAGC